MRFPVFFLLMLFLLCPLCNAQTVIYTTADDPVATPEAGVLVYRLDDATRLEKSLFPRLPGNQAQAEQQVRRMMQQPDWKARETRLTAAYQTLVAAWSDGIAKTPAVVLDNRYVVYGTTDVRLAQQLRDTWRERQP